MRGRTSGTTARENRTRNGGRNQRRRTWKRSPIIARLGVILPTPVLASPPPCHGCRIVKRFFAGRAFRQLRLQIIPGLATKPLVSPSCRLATGRKTQRSIADGARAPGTTPGFSTDSLHFGGGSGERKSRRGRLAARTNSAIASERR